MSTHQFLLPRRIKSVDFKLKGNLEKYLSYEGRINFVVVVVVVVVLVLVFGFLESSHTKKPCLVSFLVPIAKKIWPKLNNLTERRIDNSPNSKVNILKIPSQFKTKILVSLKSACYAGKNVYPYKIMKFLFRK